MTTQVASDHYDFGNYLTEARWASYYTQLQSVLGSGARSVLYIGVGDDVVPSILERQGLAVTRFDFDETLRPDIAGDIRSISSLVPAQGFDAVVCCQVLEHLPYEHFAQAVHDLAGIARRRVVISLPYRHKRLVEASIELPWLGQFPIALWTPAFWRRWTFNGEHYWEVGTKGYPKSRLRRDLGTVANRATWFHAPGNRYHLFLLLDVGATSSPAER